MPEEEHKLTMAILRVYAIFLREGRPLGVRELQRLAGFKSPSTAKYHIDRLLDAGLLRREGDGYAAVGEKPVFLALYTAFRGTLIPKTLPLAAFLIAYSLTVSALTPEQAPYMAPPALAGVLLVLESLRLLRLVPWRRSKASI